MGKARSLRDRVRSYFLANPDIKVRSILRETDDIDYILTGSEKEAVFLENNYVQQHQPRFNLKLKDDKSFPYLKVTTGETWPGVYFSRKVEPDGSRYFGPFSPPGRARSSIHLVNKHFLVRGCEEAVFRNRKRPCLEYELKLCSAPCVGYPTEAEYRESVEARLPLPRRPDARAGPHDQGQNGARGRRGEVRGGGPLARPPAHDRGLPGQAPDDLHGPRGPGRRRLRPRRPAAPPSTSSSCARARSATPRRGSWTSRPRCPIAEVLGAFLAGLYKDRESPPRLLLPFAPAQTTGLPGAPRPGQGARPRPRAAARTSSSSRWPAATPRPISAGRRRTPGRWRRFSWSWDCRPRRVISRVSTSPTRGRRIGRLARRLPGRTPGQGGLPQVPHPHRRRLQRRGQPRRSRHPAIPQGDSKRARLSPTWSWSTAASRSSARPRRRWPRSASPASRWSPSPRKRRSCSRPRVAKACSSNGPPRPQARPGRPRRDPPLRHRLPPRPPRKEELRFARSTGSRASARRRRRRFSPAMTAWRRSATPRGRIWISLIGAAVARPGPGAPRTGLPGRRPLRDASPDPIRPGRSAPAPGPDLVEEQREPVDLARLFPLLLDVVVDLPLDRLPLPLQAPALADQLLIAALGLPQRLLVRRRQLAVVVFPDVDPEVPEEAFRPAALVHERERGAGDGFILGGPGPAPGCPLPAPPGSRTGSRARSSPRPLPLILIIDVVGRVVGVVKADPGDDGEPLDLARLRSPVLKVPADGVRPGPWRDSGTRRPWRVKRSSGIRPSPS
ncbi:MAG: hypothetical protein M0C28_20965 [Candidatus Moduliflexus flocculans]|nr:hypothetical protein [Candidatus Moduliflexus flocculans]